MHRFPHACAAAVIVAATIGCGGGAVPSPAGGVAPPSASASPAAPPVAGTGSVPLRAGLTIVSAVSVPEHGDLESIHRITHVDDDSVSLTVSGEMPVEADGAGGARSVRPVRIARTVRREDLLHAREYMQVFDETDPPLFAGTTAVGVSAAILEELRTAGESTLIVSVGRMQLPDMAGSVLGAVPDFAGELNDLTKVRGTLTRVEATPAPFSLVLNDAPATLPAIHARGSFDHLLGSRQAEFWILDDPANPLVLQMHIEELGEYQVVKIAFAPETRVAAPEASAPPSDSALARQLAESGRATVYGIYFDFNSDRIKDESQPVLATIAGVLAGHPDWSLTVEGHTDDVGSAERNLDLSTRRAVAVRRALAEQYGVDPSRLVTAGRGESRPRDTNATLEGRARNRRVELVKMP